MLNEEKTILDIIDELEEHQKAFFEFMKENNLKFDTFFKTWSDKIIDKMRQNPNILRDFRRLNLTLGDSPSLHKGLKKIIFNLSSNTFLKRFHPQVSNLEDAYDFAEKENLLKNMKKFPLPLTGNVKYYKKNNILFTHKWIRHHWLLKLFDKNLAGDNSISTILDIGSNYGLFECLIKKKYPKKKFILVDFPEKLAAAKFFLNKEFPGSKFLSFKDIKEIEILDKTTINNYDFVLLPVFFINKLAKNSANLLCNFASFNEMENWWFNYYLESNVVKSIDYIFTLNRVNKPKYDQESKDSSISILDFKLETFQKIHFNICQLYKSNYEANKILGIPFFSKQVFHQPVFEFIGKKIN